MTIYDQIALRIVKEQELLMGPVAWHQASKVKGLVIKDSKKGILTINEDADGSIVINDLVSRFEGLFGRAGKEVCKEAVSALVADLQPTQVPATLR